MQRICSQLITVEAATRKQCSRGLEISKSADFKKHLNKYDVIHIDIQWCIEPAGGVENVVSYISEKTISELEAYYPNILTEKTTSLPDALSQINTAVGKKFIIIIDEWDVLIRDEAARCEGSGRLHQFSSRHVQGNGADEVYSAGLSDRHSSYQERKNAVGAE